MKRIAMAILVVLATASVSAHVGVTPRESKAGATESYTFRVPSEGGRTTTSVVLDVPASVTVQTVSAPEGATHEEARTNGRITRVTWKLTIQPVATAELKFVAANPSQGDKIVWSVHQHYTDGTVSDWVGEPGTRAPAPVTTLVR